MHVHYILQLACKVVKNKGENLIFFFRNFTWVDVPLMRKLKWISCGQISMEQDQRLTTGWKHKSSYSTCASRSWMERCPQVMWMPTTNITPFEMVKQPLLTHLLTILRSHIKFRNITDFMSCTITIKFIIADIEIKVRFLFLSLLLSVPLSILV